MLSNATRNILISCRYNTVVKCCSSSQRASQESDSLVKAAQILQPAGLNVQEYLIHFGRFLFTRFVPGPWKWDHTEKALDYLTTLHNIRPNTQLSSHYHGITLANRLDWELSSLKRLPNEFPQRKRVIHLATRIRLLRQLQREMLISAPTVIGHGDFHADNLRVQYTSNGVSITPIDWTDFGYCDPRYELAHLIDSSPDSEYFGGLAQRSYAANWIINQSFEECLYVGRAINALIELGSAARQSNLCYATLMPWLQHIENTLPVLDA